MPRPRPSRKSKPGPDPEAAPEVVEEVTPAEAEAAPGPVSKAQAVRDALAEGIEGLGEIEEFLRSRYGLEMSRPMISSYKSQAQARRSKVAKGPREAAGVRKPRKSSGDAAEADLIEALEALKPLVAAVGAEKVKRLADLLG